MALYRISYDLRKNRDYKALYDELANFNAVSILESDWCFKRINTNAENLCKHFKNFVDADDGLFVTEVTQWATFNAKVTPNDLP